jgi:hypothetical protein
MVVVIRHATPLLMGTNSSKYSQMVRFPVIEAVVSRINSEEHKRRQSSIGHH